MPEVSEHYLKKELYELIRSDDSTFDFLQNSSLDGLWYWDLEDPAQEWMSASFWQTLGVDPATKQHLAEEWQDLIFAEDLALALENFNQHLADPDHPYDQVVRYRHANGSTVWVRCRGLAIRDEQGKPTRMLGAHIDITAQMEMKERINKNLQAIDELYASTKLALEESQALFDMSPDALIQSDADGYIVRANAEASVLLGYSHNELMQMHVEQLVPEAHRQAHKVLREAHYDNPDLRNLMRRRPDIHALHKDGYEIPVEIRLNSIDTRYGKQVLAAIRDISEYVSLVSSLEKTISENKYLSMQVNTDPLTGLFNRRYFSDSLAREFSQAQRHGVTFAIMMLDVDNFKIINDSHGHDIGDKALLALTAVLKNLIRSDDILARLGGDEFVLLLPHTSAVSAEVLGERIRSKLAEQAVTIDDLSLSLSLSIGVSSFLPEDDQAQTPLKRADEALYQAKAQGRDRVISA